MTYGMLIQTVANSGTNGVSWIDFTSIPQTFTDLVLVASIRSGGAAGSSEMLLIPNTSSPSNCRNMYLTGVGNNSPGGASVTNRDYIYVGFQAGGGSTANLFGNSVTVITDYTTANPKRFTSSSVTRGSVAISAGLTATTSAITSLRVYAYGNLITQYSSMSLYGVLKGSGGATVSP
jgi:hypothetical protein